MSINEIRSFYRSDCKDLRIFDENRQNLANFTKICFSQNYSGIKSSHKNEARKLKFGLEVPIYGF